MYSVAADGRGTAAKIPCDQRLPVAPVLAVTCRAPDAGIDKINEK